jgi:hypothetical protein
LGITTFAPDPAAAAASNSFVNAGRSSATPSPFAPKSLAFKTFPAHKDSPATVNTIVKTLLNIFSPFQLISV